MLGIHAETSPSSSVPLGVGQLPAAKAAAATVVRSHLFTSVLTVEGLSPAVRKFVEENAKILQPERVYVCDGSQEENESLLSKLQQDGRLTKLSKYENW